jgi:hypothetical protein
MPGKRYLQEKAWETRHGAWELSVAALTVFQGDMREWGDGRPSEWARFMRLEADLDGERSRILLCECRGEPPNARVVLGANGRGASERKDSGGNDGSVESVAMHWCVPPWQLNP